MFMGRAASVLRRAGARGSFLRAMAAFPQAQRVHGLGLRGNGAGAFADRRAPRVVVSTSVGVAAIACAISFARGANPLVCKSALGASGAASCLLSLGMGLIVGALIVAATPAMVHRWRWASALHVALRPVTEGARGGALFVVAAATAIGEEFFFRGLLVPWIGVVASSVVFAALHQVSGPSRWGWMLWAGTMGVVFALLFVATGSLAGPIVAHVIINHCNLRFLRDHDPASPSRPLGGLLRR
jgi:membrane protease YdiL (CAAX protease family)